MAQSEFDDHAGQYERLLAGTLAEYGGEVEYFSEYKVKALNTLVKKFGVRSKAIFDFGCGVGNSIPWFKIYFPDSMVICSDVSLRSLEVAQKHLSDQDMILHISGDRINQADNSVDLVFATCVFHHIPPVFHSLWFSELYRILRPGGLIMIFEHNPYNPVTRAIVRDCPFDENAILIPSSTLKKHLNDSGFKLTGLRFTVFFPEVLRFLRPLESYLTWMPLGAQYAAYGIK